MATFAISAVTRKAQATANGSTDEFSFSFSVNTEADVAVFVGTTLKTISTHYTVSITASTGAGSITFTSGNTPTNGQIVTIMSKTALARSSVYTSGGTINATSLETDFDTNMMLFQQQDERLDRVITAPVDDATSIDMTLPNKDARKGTVLGFNATSGNPEAGPSITAVQSLADVTTAINLLGTSDAVSDMNTLATSSNVTNQNTLAGISGNITTVAGIASNVTSVAGDATDIGAVAGKATEIGLLANSTTIANMGQLGTSAVVEDMGLLATSAVIEDMGLLANSAVIEDMGLLATSAVIEDMGLLATSAVIEDMGLLATSSVISDMSTLAGSGSTPTVTSIGVSGALTANGGAVFNENSADVDFRVESNGNGNMLFVDGGNDAVVIGHNDATNGTFASSQKLQMVGTDFLSSSFGISRFSADASEPSISFSKSRAAGIGTDTVVQDNDALGSILFTGADGTDLATQGASISAVVDGTPGSNDMPTRLIFSTTGDGAESPTARMTIHSGGVVSIPGGIELGSGLDATAANTLDDYEEGSWTPTGSNITFAEQAGLYVKIGNVVHVGAKVHFPTTSDSGDAKITGLPFTSTNSNAARAGITVSWHDEGSSNGLAFLITNNSTQGIFYLGASSKTNANMSGHEAYIGGTYLSG